MRWSALLVLAFPWFSAGALIRDVQAEPGPILSKPPAHVAVYENIVLDRVTQWISTEILIPKGALVAVIARGEVWNVRGPSFRCGPDGCLRFRVGDTGPPRALSSYHSKDSVSVAKSHREGLLHFIIGPGFQHVKNKRAEMTATVLVWKGEHGTRVEEDMEQLVRDHPGQAVFEALRLALANALTVRGEYSRAEALLQRIRDSAGSEGKMAAFALSLSANNENWMRRYDRAQVLAVDALKVCRQGGYRGLEADSLLHRAEALSHTGQREKAMEAVREALDILSKEPRGLGLLRRRGRAHSMMGSLLWYERKNAKAIEHFTRAAGNFNRAGAWPPLAQTLFFLGRSQNRAGMRAEGQRSLERAFKISTALGRQETLWRIHFLQGRIAERDGDAPKAFEQYAEAIGIIESMRGDLADPETRAAFMENKWQVYEVMIGLLQRLNRHPEAFHYLERAKSRVMLDMLQRKALSSRKSEENELLVRERDLRHRLEEIGSPGQDIPVSDEEGEEESAEREVEALLPEMGGGEIDRLRQEHADILRRIDRLNPELASLVTVNPLQASEIQAMLDPDTVLLAYYVGWEVALVFVVTRERVAAVALETSRRELLDAIQRFRREAVEEISVEEMASKGYSSSLLQLYASLIKPVEERVAGKRHLVIVPHGILHYLPFQALLRKGPDGAESYLIESFTVSYLPSASLLRFVRTKVRERKGPFLAVGNPATDLASLPAAEVEAREVSSLFQNSTLLTGQQATETSVKNGSPRFDMVLLSTHGEMIESDPLQSNLRFTPSSSDDGRLTVGEIFDMEVRADLVTLSACETGLVRGLKGGFPTGDDLVGLSRAFIHAGTPSVVASLWKVSDDSTVTLMRTFYGKLREMSKAEALRQAQLELMRTRLTFRLERGGGITRSAGYQPGVTIDCSHPFFWAPFILVGEWR